MSKGDLEKVIHSLFDVFIVICGVFIVNLWDYAQDFKITIIITAHCTETKYKFNILNQHYRKLNIILIPLLLKFIYFLNK